MKKQSTPASAEPIEEIVLSAKKPRASKTKAAVTVKAAVTTPQHGQAEPIRRKEANIVIRASDFSYDELRVLWTALRRQGVNPRPGSGSGRATYPR